jgi:hypothetical protein
MISKLAFDSRCMTFLLSEKFQSYFSDVYPVFYKNKLQTKRDRLYYRSAIDTALKANQARAIQEIIEFVVKFQNNYISSFLFFSPLP